MGQLAGGQCRKTGFDAVAAEGTLKRAALGVSQLDHRRRFRSSERARLQGRAGAAGIAGGTEAQGESYFEARYEGEEANLNCREFHGPAWVLFTNSSSI